MLPTRFALVFPAREADVIVYYTMEAKLNIQNRTEPTNSTNSRAFHYTINSMYFPTSSVNFLILVHEIIKRSLRDSHPCYFLDKEAC